MTTKKYLLTLNSVATTAVFNKKLELQTFILYYKKQFYYDLISVCLIYSYRNILKLYKVT